MKDYIKILNKIIDTGIEGAKRDYVRKDQKLLLDGSVAGFEACRNKNPIQLKKLLEEAMEKSNQKMLRQAKDYWYYRGYTLEVEWVCNVMNALLVNSGYTAITISTARGILRAAEILGIIKER